MAACDACGKVASLERTPTGWWLCGSCYEMPIRHTPRAQTARLCEACGKRPAVPDLEICGACAEEIYDRPKPSEAWEAREIEYERQCRYDERDTH